MFIRGKERHELLGAFIKVGTGDKVVEYVGLGVDGVEGVCNVSCPSQPLWESVEDELGDDGEAQ